MADTHTWMHNPATDGYWQCPVGAVEIWQGRGWVLCEAPPEVDETTAHWAKSVPEPAAPAAKKTVKPMTPATAENKEKIDG